MWVMCVLLNSATLLDSVRGFKCQCSKILPKQSQLFMEAMDGLGGLFLEDFSQGDKVVAFILKHS